MNRILDPLIKSKFIKNVLIMATGSAGAQAVTMLFSPIITRLYGPEVFGMMGAFTALISMALPIAALTYPIAIVLPKNDNNARGIIKLSLYITLSISIFIMILVVLFNKNIVELFQLEAISQYLYLLPLVIIFGGIMEVSQQWLIRTNQFSINAKVTFLQSLITNGSKAGIGVYYPAASVLITIQTIGIGLQAFMMIFLARKSNYRSSEEPREEILPSKMLAKKYIDFPLFRAPQVFLAGISDGLPILLLTAFFGPASAGFYSIGRTVLGLPSKFIGQSIGDVFYPRIAKAANSGENLTRLITKATILLGVVGIIPFGIVIIFGPWLFEFVFGEGWDVAGEYARWISLTSFVVFINKPSVRSLPVLNAQKLHLVHTIILVAIRSLGLAIGFYLFNSDIVAIALFGLSSVAMNIALFLITIKLSKDIK